MARGVKTGGRQKGTPNKISGQLKDLILKALELAGGEGGAVEYLKQQAKANPSAFLSLVGRTLPTEAKIQSDVTHRYVARVPEKAATADSWQQQHSPEATQH